MPDEAERGSWTGMIPLPPRQYLIDRFARAAKEGLKVNSLNYVGQKLREDRTKARNEALYVAKANHAESETDYYRLEFGFEVDPRTLGDDFFNSWCGLRGHYYRSAEEGDRFTLDCLVACGDVLKKALKQALEAQKPEGWGHGPRDLDKWLNASILGGKIWVLESGNQTWADSDFVPDSEIDDFRWNYSRATEATREQALLEDLQQEGDDGEKTAADSDRLWHGGGSAPRITMLDIKTGFLSLQHEPWTADAKLCRGIWLHHVGWV